MQQHKLKILYVEDDEYSREVMSILLTNILGYEEVRIYPDSADFEMHLDQLSYVPDIIFLDIHVQPKNGFELLKICKRRRELRNTKIIALTASIMAAEVEQLYVAGFDGLVGKPVNQLTFPKTIQSILNGESIWEEV